ncbi:MAG TPA: peptidoglycan bridge formation glycyltransferase FemA/FemB family protein, partial [Candidatus Saccharimonadales bacterium]|nr:peptidoglycan bridge formation glycyltransferase FemA/FemB family protein [Candidatus Saccharimonadales bacterium]
MVTIHKGVPDRDWDDQVCRLSGHFLQSRAWAQFQAALGRQVLWACDASWAWLAAERRGRGVMYLYCAYGPCAAAGGLSEAIQSLTVAGRERGADFGRFEPSCAEASEGRPTSIVAELERLGAQPFSEVNPAHTWVLDLSPDEAVLRSGLSSGNRNIINKAERTGISCREADARQIEPFLSMLRDTYGRAGIKAYDDDYYRTMLKVLHPAGAARLVYAYYQGKPVAGAIVYDWNGRRHYAHAAADQAVNREINAARMLVWYLIMEAKHSGLTSFDFWGVAPTDDPGHPWHGLSKFKKSFGGEGVEYAGTWDLPINKPKYRLYR